MKGVFENAQSPFSLRKRHKKRSLLLYLERGSERENGIEIPKVAQAGKNFQLTFIQVICALSVVILHTNGCFWQFSATEKYWFTANIIESVFYFAVPIFFMITGITLIDYQNRYSTTEYFKKRFKKTVIPYIAWSLIGVLFLIATKRIAPENVTAKWVINGLLSTGGIINLYWFFQPLFCVYLSLPLFAAVDNSKKTNIARYLMVSSIFINILLPFLNNVFHLGFEWPYQLIVASGYLFWVWSGYYVYHNPPSIYKKVGLYICAIIGLLLHIIGTYQLSVKTGSIQSLFKGYNNLPCVLYTLGVFVLLMDLGSVISKVTVLKQIFETMGRYTFPVYLIHWFVLRILNDIFVINTKAISYRLLMPFLIYVIIMIFVRCLRNIPFVRDIVP